MMPIATDLNELSRRYVAVWNQPDPAIRRQLIIELWSDDGAHVTATLHARGHEAIAARVANSHHQWVDTEGMHFTSSTNATGHHNVVKFNWEMVPDGGGAPTSIGFDFLILADDGRIDLDYQFIE